MRRLLSVALGLCALATVTVNAAAPTPAAADTFGGWTYSVEVNAARFDGLALNGVTFNGVKVLERISLPVMSVFYDNNACGPYADRLGGASYTGPFGEDFTQNGVRWRSIGLTDQIGSYTITMMYYLSENGELDAHMFSKGLQCNIRHDHVPFWRMDFDVAGPANDQVRRDSGNGFITSTTEFSLPATAAAGHRWEVRDSVTSNAVTIAFDNGSFGLPGTVIPESEYVNNRVYGRQYKANETSWTGGATRASLFGDEGESLSDLVLWYTGYMPHSPAEGPSLWHSTGIRLQVTPQAAGLATLGDQVTDSNGAPVAGVALDLFDQNPDGSRRQWRASTASNASGKYSFSVNPGCYTVVAIAPTGATFVGGSRYAERPACVSAGQSVLTLDAVLNATTGGSGLGDRVSYDNGTGAPGVAADLFQANADGSRGQYLSSTTTGPGGDYRFDTSAGCYVVVFVAPAGRTFTGGGIYHQQARCVSAGQFDNTVDAVLAGSGSSPATIGDRVTRAATGAGVAGVDIDLFVANGDGSRGQWLADTLTDANGNYRFATTAGCYVVVFIAPSGQAFVGGGQYRQQATCVSAGATDASIDAALA
jgi:protocatechuate 3,4-dioxygenase beta subunit